MGSGDRQSAANFGISRSLFQERFENSQGPMVGRRRLDGPAELAVDIAHPLVGPAVLEPYLRLLGGLPREGLVVVQSLLEKLFLKRVKTVFQPVLGHLGVHVVNGLAGLQALGLGLAPLDLRLIPLDLRLIPLDLRLISLARSERC